MNPEQRGQESSIETIPTEYTGGNYLLLHLREKILPGLIQPLPDREITLLDYGCGDGRTIAKRIKSNVNIERYNFALVGTRTS